MKPRLNCRMCIDGVHLQYAATIDGRFYSSLRFFPEEIWRRMKFARKLAVLREMRNDVRAAANARRPNALRDQSLEDWKRANAEKTNDYWHKIGPIKP